MYLKDSDGNPSVTVTAFVMGFIVACVKLLIAGHTIYGVQFGEFTGGEFAAVVGALGTIYALRRSKVINNDNRKE
jgi:uncharacterized YccA/Bax inhibitor family protein